MSTTCEAKRKVLNHGRHPLIRICGNKAHDNCLYCDKPLCLGHAGQSNRKSKLTNHIPYCKQIASREMGDDYL